MSYEIKIVKVRRGASFAHSVRCFDAEGTETEIAQGKTREDAEAFARKLTVLQGNADLGRVALVLLAALIDIETVADRIGRAGETQSDPDYATKKQMRGWGNHIADQASCALALALPEFFGEPNKAPADAE